MKTVNSLSGGKTSSYLAVHFPADYNVFALITIDDIRCAPKDKSLIKYVSNKINKEFIATAESDLTLKAMIDLEQLIGKEIIWLNRISFDNVSSVKNKNWLPSIFRRTCTIEMKIMAIWDWWYANIGEKVKMGIGYRYDELERAERFSNKWKGIIGKSKNGRNIWKEIEWREGYFPLIENKITHFRVKEWADKSGIIFPSDSNCVGCFHKPIQQLRKNWDEHPEKMQWFSDQENQKGKNKGTWKENISYEQIKKIGLQTDFNFGTGSGCQAGFCTD
jgi:hypothetical protein